MLSIDRAHDFVFVWRGAIVLKKGIPCATLKVLLRILSVVNILNIAYPLSNFGLTGVKDEP